MSTIEKNRIQLCFAKELLAYRQAHRLSQSKLARKLSITDRQYSALEHGEYCPSVVTLLAFMQEMTEEERGSLLCSLLNS